MDKAKFTPPPKQEWNQNLIMEELRTGRMRPGFVGAVEKRLQTLMEDHPNLLHQHTPDDLAETLNSILVEEGQKLFKKQEKGRNIEYETAKKKRISLLEERSKLKEEIQSVPEEGWKLEQVQNDLAKISKELAKLRKTQWQDTQYRLNDEIHEAWDKRDMKSAYKLLRQLAGSKFDIKKRDWRLVKQALPTRKEWEDLLQEAGCKGGMMAKTSTWHEMREEHISVANDLPLPPKDMNQIMQAREDVKKLAKHVIFCKKRKAVPQDSLPVELLVALLAPNYKQKPVKQALQSMSDSIPTSGTHSDYSKPIHFVSGPAIPAADGRPAFHEAVYKPPNSPTLTLKTHLFSYMHKSITQDALH